MNSLKVAGVIPARYGSTRLPGKPLKTILGKTLIERVYQRCAEAELLDTVLVATDDQRIAQAVESFGGRSVLTRADHPSGTDRLAEVAESLEADVVVNIQGDQPFLNPVMIEEAVSPLLADTSVQLCTLMVPIARDEEMRDPAVVKVVVDLAGNALFFSRSRIPYGRVDVPHHIYEHVGMYVYRRETLLKVAQLPPTVLERVEALEQLRWLEHGLRIRVVESKCPDRNFSGFSVDTPEDLARAEQMLRERGLN